jgi:tetratricopeptide (TPR) repeat protein/thiol-disulfide isomerase/thioredoxin
MTPPPPSEALTLDVPAPAVSAYPLRGNFGDYHLLAEIARGGMGVVFRARQKSLGRVVALKMILAGQLASIDQVRRFRAEAEEAGCLDHPNIVPIYQVGEVNGQHYFSMKLIEGSSLGAQAERLRKDPPAAARLISTVARAVQHAHARGVLHRDLKPGNILIDEHGQPHVTDFGLAKHLGGEGSTQSGAILGTPGYMAPEQAAGRKDVSVAADVHGLGAVLYELLTGQPPFRAETPLETVMQVLESDPAPPRSLNPAIPLDLETICLKCLRKEPTQRYRSVAALADDLDHFLADEPIQARRAGRMERTIKWARRRPAGAALLGVTALAILALTAGGWWSNAQLKIALDKSESSAREAQIERTRAAAGFQKDLETIDDLLINLDGRLAQKEDMESVRIEFLREFLAIGEKLQQDRPTDPVARRQRGRVWARIGDVHWQQGHYDEGDRAFRAARQIQEELANEFPDQSQYRADLALTFAQHARVLLQRGQQPAARAALQKGFEIQDELARKFPDEPNHRFLAERYRFELGNALEEAGQTAQARAAYVQALDGVEKLTEQKPSAQYHNYIGLITDSLGALLLPTEPAEALRLFEYSLEVRRKAWQLAPHLSSYQQDLRSAYRVLGLALRDQGKYAELAALADRLAADAPEPRVDTYSSACLMALAATAAGKSSVTEHEKKLLAEGYAERAIKLLQKATQAGYASNRDDREHMDRDTDLVPLRQRDDYKSMLARLDARLPPPPQTPVQEVESLAKEYRSANFRYRRLLGEAVTVAQKARAQAYAPHLELYAGRFLKLAEKHRDSPASLTALTWVLGQTESDGNTTVPGAAGKLRKRALEAIQRDHLARPDLDEVCRLLSQAADPQCDSVLTTIHEKHPLEKMRGIAALALALSRSRQAERCRSSNSSLAKVLSAQAEEKLLLVIERFSGVRLASSTLGAIARKALQDVRYLNIGSVAQDIDGEDLNGKRLKLSDPDHRGKVIVLDFWANWCGYCRVEYAATRGLVQRLAGRPFVYLGINCDDDRTVVNRVVSRNSLNWRSWYDGGSEGGRIQRQWQIEGFPSTFVLDHKRVIRFKGLRGERLAEAVEVLLREVEGDATKKGG